MDENGLTSTHIDTVRYRLSRVIATKKGQKVQDTL